MTIQDVAKAFVHGEPARCHNASTDGAVYTLHNSPIVVKSGGEYVFYWCGVYTKTTAAHMNAVLKILNKGIRCSYAAARDSNETHFVIGG